MAQLMTHLWSEMIGVWTLDGVAEFGADGQVRGRPYGDEPAGRLMYTRDAHMAVVISGYGPAPAVAYAGHVAVDRDRVQHLVAVGLPPFSEDQERFARVEDGGAVLILATDRPGNPRTELRWVRQAPQGIRTK
ncbi:lipocalin-like domain-containing protein [Streptomyces sp. NPDC091292]|uniref:lipocalin-like domain-containing protein n=1 Tax=Streptomyces sp. NPDC091292 TaxID=3365991 RepID=UPI003800FF7F